MVSAPLLHMCLPPASTPKAALEHTGGQREAAMGGVCELLR